ncbi:MAG: oligosaccharide flippase family protein [Tissierellia bacterium]|nr:oligosaccharide flippase family protein [Tissierellia bacterium]MDD4781633.1 oligosaccharide flippase family protein [Tissierellia bacterium]
MRNNLLYSILNVVFNAIVPILVFPYIARVLGVEALGKYNFYASAQSYLLLISSFGVSIYGVKELGKINDSFLKRKSIYSELISINLITCLICSIFIFYIAFFSKYNNDWKIILIFGTSLFSSVIGPDWYFIATENQKYLLLRNIFFKILFVFCVFIFIKDPSDLLIYVVITIIGTYGTSVFNFFVIKKEIDIRFVFGKKLYRHIKPLFGIFLIEVLLRFLGLGDVVLLGRLKGDISVGFYSMALKVILLSISVMNITATTLLPRASYYLSNNQESNFKLLTKYTISTLFTISGLFFLIIYWNADLIILILGGKDFAPSVDVLKMLSITLLFIPIINTLVFQVLYAKNRVKMLVITYIFALIINIALNIIFVSRFDFKGTAYAFLLTYLILFIIFILNKKEKLLTYFSNNIIKTICSIIMTFSLCYFLVFGLKLNNVIVINMCILLIYFGLLLMFQEETIIKVTHILDLKNKKYD